MNGALFALTFFFQLFLKILFNQTILTTFFDNLDPLQIKHSRRINTLMKSSTSSKSFITISIPTKFKKFKLPNFSQITNSYRFNFVTHRNFPQINFITKALVLLVFLWSLCHHKTSKHTKSRELNLIGKLFFFTPRQHYQVWNLFFLLEVILLSHHLERHFFIKSDILWARGISLTPSFGTRK